MKKKIKGEFKNYKCRTNFKGREYSGEINRCFVLLVTFLREKILFLFLENEVQVVSDNHLLRNFLLWYSEDFFSLEVNYSTQLIWIRVWAWNEVINFIFPQSVLILSLPEIPVPIATATISDITPASNRAQPMTDNNPAAVSGEYFPGLEDQVTTDSYYVLKG